LDFEIIFIFLQELYQQNLTALIMTVELVICVSFGSISYHLITINHMAKNQSATIKNDNKKVKHI